MRLGARTSLGLACLLMISLMAGCLGGQTGEEVEPTNQGAPATSETASASTSDDDQRSTTSPLGPDSVVEAPDWEVGQWFGYHVFFGQEDEEGVHYDSAVIAEDGSSWTLAPANEYLATIHSISDLMVLGQFSKEDLSTTSEGEAWEWYSFPLRDGKTWTATYSFFGETVEATFNATYQESIELSDGTAPGFEVVGKTADGATFMEYDYVPELGWFAHLFIYDPTSDSDEWEVHLMTMGHGEDWTGTAYTAETSQVLDMSSGVSPLGPTAQTEPYGTFALGEEITYLYGFAYAFAFTGAHETVLVDPNHETHEFQAVAAMPMAGASAGGEIFTEAVPGQWHAASAGAGVAAFGGVFAWASTVAEHPLTDGQLGA